MVHGQIEIISDPKRPTHSIAPGNFMILGRGSNADIMINDTAVSKNHCRIFFENDKFLLQDLQSSNGSYLNGQKVLNVVPLKDGDTIKIGKTEMSFKLVEQVDTLVVQAVDFEKQAITLRPQDAHAKNIEDDLFARLSLSHLQPGFTRDHIAQCIQYKASNPDKSLKDIMIAKGCLSQENAKTIEITLNNILNHEKMPTPAETEFGSSREDNIFFKAAQTKGFLTYEQIQAASMIQKQMQKKGESLTIVQLLQKEGYLSQSQIAEIQQELNRKIPYKIEGYELHSLLGVGGMGSVYKATQLSMERTVAVKILSNEYRSNEYLNSLFLKEARAVAKLNHENIIAGYDFGEANGISYFVMEYVDGPSLHRKLQQSGGSLPISEAVTIGIQVAKALEHAGEKGLIHRDIKPENILLTSENIVKLCDLGLAQKLNEQNLKRQKDFGTPAYMSPEQIRCEQDLDIRSDMYSLGCVLYRVVFGVLPFTGTTREIMSKHLSERIKFPENLDKSKQELAKIIQKMVAKKRDDRFQKPSDIIAALTELRVHIEKGDWEKTQESVNQPSVGQKSVGQKSVGQKSVAQKSTAQKSDAQKSATEKVMEKAGEENQAAKPQASVPHIKMIPRHTMAFKNSRPKRDRRK